MRHHPDPVVAGVGDQQISRAVHRHIARIEELGGTGRSAAAREPGGAVAGHGVDVARGHRLPVEHAAGRGHHPDAAARPVGDHQVARAVHRHPGGALELSSGSRPTVPQGPMSAIAGHGVDVAGGHCLPVEHAGAGRHHPDPMVSGVGDQQVARTVHRHAAGAPELGRGGRAAVPGEPGRAIARDGIDVTGGHRPAVEHAGARRHHPDPAVAGVGDQQVARTVHRHALRGPELGCGGQAAVPGVPRGAIPGHGVDVPGFHRLPVEGAGPVRHHPDRVTALVRDRIVAVADDQVARPVHRHAVGRGDVGFGGQAAIPGRPDGPIACHRVDVPGRHRLPVEGAGPRRHYPDPVVAPVADHEVALVVHHDSARVEQVGAGRRAAIAKRPAGAGTGRRGQPAGPLVHAPHRARVGDVQAAGAVGHPAGSLAVVADVGDRYRPGPARAADARRDGRDVPGRGRHRVPVHHLVGTGQAGAVAGSGCGGRRPGSGTCHRREGQQSQDDASPARSVKAHAMVTSFIRTSRGYPGGNARHPRQDGWGARRPQTKARLSGARPASAPSRVQVGDEQPRPGRSDLLIVGGGSLPLR